MRDAPARRCRRRARRAATRMAFWLYTSGTTGDAQGRRPLPPDAPQQAVTTAGDVLGRRPAATGSSRPPSSSSPMPSATRSLLPLSRAAGSCFLHPAWADAAPVVLDVLRGYRPTLYLLGARRSTPRLLRADAAARRLQRPCGAASPRASGCRPRSTTAGASASASRSSTASARLGDGVHLRSRTMPAGAAPGSTGTVVVREARSELLDAAGQPGRRTAQQGVLWAKTPSTAAGYWQRLDHSRRTFVGEWFRTGDVYVRDAGGFYDPLRARGRFLQGRRAVGRCRPSVEAALMNASRRCSRRAWSAPRRPAGLVKPFVFVVPPRRHGRCRRRSRPSSCGIAEEMLPSHQRPREHHRSCRSCRAPPRASSSDSSSGSRSGPRRARD